MILELLNEFFMDFVILGLSCFGYLLRPYVRRLLAAGKIKLRLMQAWRSLLGLWALFISGPSGCWTKLSRWRLSRAQLRLLELGQEIERFNLAAARNFHKDDDGGELRLELEPGLVSELAQVYASDKFLASSRTAPLSPMALGGDNLTRPELDLEFLSRDDPVICSVNWIDADLICFQSGARGNYVDDKRRPITNETGGSENSEQLLSMASNVANSTSDKRIHDEVDDYDNCSDHVSSHGPVNVSSKSCLERNKSELANHIAGMQTLNEALNNSSRVPEGEQSSSTETLTSRESERPQAGAKAGPNDEAAAADDDGLRRRRSQPVAASDGESHFSVSHEDQLVHVRGVWSGTNRQLIMLEQQQRQQQEHKSEKCNSYRRDVSKKDGIVFCLVKYCTGPELLLHDRRAALIFYLIQLHSQRLVQLFGLISLLLERAGLLGASGFWCRSVWPKLDDGHAIAMDDAQELEDWLELIGWELAQHDQSAWLASERQPMRPHQMTLMGRYALVLMIAAYLERERAGGGASAGSSGKQIGLASSLMGFLECFSGLRLERKDDDDDGHDDHDDGDDNDKEVKTSLVVVRNGLSKAAPVSHGTVRMEIEFISLANASGSDDSNKANKRGETELAVLDPIGPELVEGGKWLSADDEFTKSGANLTADLTVWREIRQLFADSLRNLRLAMAAEPATTTSPAKASGTNTTGSLLAGLAELAQRSRTQRRALLPKLSAQIGKLGCDQPPKPVPTAAKNQLYIVRDSGKLILRDRDGGGGEFVRANNTTGSHLDQSRRTAGWRLRLKTTALRHVLANKLGRSIFFLMLFVAIRISVLRYLEVVQRDLMFEARHEFIALKRMVFPQGLRDFTENEDDEDGISILTRDERRQRAEDERRRRAKPRPDTSQRASGTTEADDGDQNEKASGRNHEPAIQQNDTAESTGDVNKMMETMITMLMSQAFGGLAGGSNPGDFSKMDPQQLQQMMRMLEGFEAGDGGDSDDDLDYDDIDEAQLSKVMEQMQLGDGIGTKFGNLDKLMGAGSLDVTGANIDSGTSANGNRDDDDDDDTNHQQHDGDNSDDKVNPIWPQSREESAQTSDAAEGEL